MRALALSVLLLAAPASAEGLREDHARHFVAGLGVGALTYAATPMVFGKDVPRWVPFATAAGASLAAGLLKEGLDLLGTGTPEANDWIATAVGGVAGALLASLLQWALTMGAVHG